MNKFFLLLLLVSLFIACERFPWEKEEKVIHGAILDAEGNLVKETAAGTIIQLRSDDFKKAGSGFLKDAKVFFNDKEGKIISLQGNLAIVEVPLMYHYQSVEIIISFIFKEYRYKFFERLYYRPTVTGVVFAGLKDFTFQMPAEMTIDAAGNLYVIDQRDDHDVIVKITSAGVSTVFSSSTNFGRLVGIGIDESRNRLYVSDASSQQIKYINLSTPGLPYVLAGSGKAGNTDGTGMRASFNFGSQRVDDFGRNETGQGLVVDALGNVLVAEQYGTSTIVSQVRKITPTGHVTTVAGSKIDGAESSESVKVPAGLTVNSSNEIYTIGGSSTLFQGIVKITPGGKASDLAGKPSNESLKDGLGTAAEFTFPKAITTDSYYLYVADGTNGALRRVTPDGEVITLAGVGHKDTPTFCFCGPKTPTGGSYIMPGFFNKDPERYLKVAKAIVLDQLGGVALKNGGLIYVSDYGYKCIWEITII